jgi:hypothetical protein
MSLKLYAGPQNSRKQAQKKTLLLFVNVIKKSKAAQMCEPPYSLSKRDTEHSSQNRCCPAKIGTSRIHNFITCKKKQASRSEFVGIPGQKSVKSIKPGLCGENRDEWDP